MSELYAESSPKLQARRKELAPEQLNAFHEFSRRVFAEGALSTAPNGSAKVAKALEAPSAQARRAAPQGRYRPRDR
jgi:hypothetical protein